jgi:WD40 repeat protein
MCCTHAMTRRVKFIRSVAFSPDSRLLAVGSEEDTVDLTDQATGEQVGSVNLSPRRDGAEEIAFHPVQKYVLACARTDTGNVPKAPVTVARLTVA